MLATSRARTHASLLRPQMAACCALWSRARKHKRKHKQFNGLIMQTVLMQPPPLRERRVRQTSPTFDSFIYCLAATKSSRNNTASLCNHTANNSRAYLARDNCCVAHRRTKKNWTSNELCDDLRPTTCKEDVNYPAMNLIRRRRRRANWHLVAGRKVTARVYTSFNFILMTLSR